MKFSFKHSVRWSIFILCATFIISCVLSVTSTTLLEGASWGIGMLIVLLLILTGIFFDILGLAAAAAKETPFHAMASEKLNGSKQAIRIVRNNDRFSNFCNDVVGDMCGIISGTATAFVVIKLLASADSTSVLTHTVVSVILTACVSALTVGGKAVGKSFAIHFCTEIVLIIGKFFYFLETRLGIRLFVGAAKSRVSNGRRGSKRVSRTNQSA